MPIKTFPTETKEVVSLYNDTVRLEFSPTGHRYKIFHNGVELFGTKGVTTITDIIDKPALVQWAANLTNEAWVNGLRGKVVDEVLISKLEREIPLVWRNTRDAAGDIGTLIHKWVETYIKSKINKTPSPGAPINEIMQGAVMRFIEWEKKSGVTFIASEKKVYSLRHNIAGTLDFIYRTKEGKLGVGDLKTSAGIYDGMKCQVAGYRYMLEEENPDVKYDEMTIVKVGKVDGDLQVKRIDDYQSYAKAFLACIVLHNIMKPSKKV